MRHLPRGGALEGRCQRGACTSTARAPEFARELARLTNGAVLLEIRPPHEGVIAVCSPTKVVTSTAARCFGELLISNPVADGAEPPALERHVLWSLMLGVFQARRRLGPGGDRTSVAHDGWAAAALVAGALWNVCTG